MLLDHGAESNMSTVHGQITALMCAAEEGHAEVIELLLGRGADPNAELGCLEAIGPAAAGRHDAVAVRGARRGTSIRSSALLDGGAEVNQAGADNTSPLLIAVVNGHYDVASALLERGADPSIADHNGRSPLYAAIDLRNVQWSQAPAPELPQAEHMAMIRRLVDAGADLGIKISGKVKHRGSFDMRWTDLKGGTPFLRAAWNGDIEVMRLLLDHGADPMSKTDNDETALLLLAGAGWPLGQGHIRSDAEIKAALDLLVGKYKMDVNAATKEGITALMCAVFKGDNDVVQYLVDHGARLDAKDNEGRTVITWARGIAANQGQPPRPQPQTEKLLRELMQKQGITIAMLD